MAKMKCPCRYTYDPEKGDPKQGIPSGTQFEDLPDVALPPLQAEEREICTRRRIITTIIILLWKLKQ